MDSGVMACRCPTHPTPLSVVVGVPFKQEQKPALESEPRPLLKPRLQVEPRLLAEPQTAVEPTQLDDADGSEQQTQPAALPVPAPELQNLFQPIEQPQPDKPPSPPPKPEVIYSDQVSCHRTRDLYVNPC